MEKQAIIEFKNFSFQYYSQSEPTLHDIDLTIYEGEKVLIVGPSGSGKAPWDIASMG
jgi:energy-coupling factor transport system ATP-binding protein